MIDPMALLRDPRAYASIRWHYFLEHCFVPKVFYDIGANDPYAVEGQATVYKPLMPDTRFFLFEAMAKHEAALARTGEPYALALLSDRDGAEKVFYETARFAPGTGDSYYRERTTVYEDDAAIATRQTTRRLDSVVAERAWPLPDFMKLDTQGSELDILRGAPKCLAAARGLQIECNVRDFNEGAPLMSSVLAFAADAGFRLHDFIQFHFSPDGELLQVDALFVR